MEPRQLPEFVLDRLAAGKLEIGTFRAYLTLFAASSAFEYDKDIYDTIPLQELSKLNEQGLILCEAPLITALASTPEIADMFAESNLIKSNAWDAHWKHTRGEKTPAERPAPAPRKARVWTEAEILAKRSPNGGYTYKALREMGVPTPQPSGWKKQLKAGIPFTREQFAEAAAKRQGKPNPMRPTALDESI